MRHLKLEENLAIYSKSYQDSGLLVSAIKIQLRAKVIASNQLTDFKGSQSWCCCFIDRKGLSVQVRTIVC